MSRILATLAFVGFLLSFAVHLSASAGIDVSARIPFVWMLHVGIFVVFVPFVFASQKVLGPKPTFTQIRELFPHWVVVLGAVILGYAMLNFLVFMFSRQGGSPSIQDGKFVLQEHGRLIRELTAVEYSAFKAKEVRGFSGHWLVFYFVPFAYFMFCKKPNHSFNGPPAGAR